MSSDTMIRRKPVNSGAVTSVGYDPKTSTLDVEFRGGKVYRYGGVPQELHAAIHKAESVGSFIAKNIANGSYPHTLRR